jgi:RNA polymerase sigma-70 factor, ECF subfamily
VSGSSSHLPPPGHSAPLAVVSDETLLRRILQREPEALSALYDRYSPLVYTTALHITGDMTMAESVVMAVFKTIWHTGASCFNNQTIAAWVLCITRHHAATEMKQYKRPYRQARGSNAKAQQHTPSGEQCVSYPCSTSVRSALTSLTAAERTVIELAYYHGLSATQLASLLGESVEHVKLYLREALLKLRDYLAGDKDERTV